MSRTVFILGAGASAEAGAPLMGNFLEVAESLRFQAGIGFKDDFELVLEGRAELQAVHSKANIDIENLESVFAAFEMAALRESLGGLGKDKVDRLLRAIRRTIARTLELTVLWRGHPREVKAPHPYPDFARLLRQMIERRETVSVITFNYDLAVDSALATELDRSTRIDYCLKPSGTLDEALRFDLMKLHGSLNWARCAEPSCREIAPWNLREFFEKVQPFPEWRRAVQEGRPDFHVMPLRLELASSIQNYFHGSHPCEDEPVIVPPTWSKSEHYRLIAPVWQRAAQHLSEAENIFVIGYSLTPADQSFRYLYALGTVGPSWLKRIWVIDPIDEGPGRVALVQRYQDLLGLAARRRFQHVGETFSGALQRIRNELRLGGA